MKPRQIIGVVLAVVLVGAGAYTLLRPPKPAVPDHKKMAVTASIYPLYDVAQAVGGEWVSVTNVTPAGAEPHDYEPTPRQLAEAGESKVFLYNGGTMEPWVDKFVADYKGIAVKGSAGLTLRQGTDEETGQPVAGSLDPHYWLDPVMMQTVTGTVADALVQADPAHAAYYRGRAADYKAKLAALDARFGMGVVRCKSNVIVTSHAAFSYLAARYDLRQVAIAGLSPDAEPNAARLAELATFVKDNQVSTIFFEELTSPKLAKTLAQETGVKTAVLNPIEGVSEADQKAGKDYISIQGDNLANLRLALTCR